MDDLQSYFCVQPQNQTLPGGVTVNDSVLGVVMELFKKKEVPLSFGAIGSSVNQGDQNLANFWQRIRGDANFQIVDHSYSHQVFKGQTLSWQVDDLEQSLVEIPKAFNLPESGITLFVAPENEYDDNTLQAMQDNELTAISDQCSWNGDGTTIDCPPDAKVVAPAIYDARGIAHLPVGAVLGDGDGHAYWSQYSTTPADFDAAKMWAERQIANQGFSVFMLHGNEFQNFPAGDTSCFYVDATKYQVLEEVLDYANDNWCPVSFNQLIQMFPAQ